MFDVCLDTWFLIGQWKNACLPPSGRVLGGGSLYTSNPGSEHFSEQGGVNVSGHRASWQGNGGIVGGGWLLGLAPLLPWRAPGRELSGSILSPTALGPLGPSCCPSPIDEDLWAGKIPPYGRKTGWSSAPPKPPEVHWPELHWRYAMGLPSPKGCGSETCSLHRYWSVSCCDSSFPSESCLLAKESDGELVGLRASLLSWQQSSQEPFQEEGVWSRDKLAPSCVASWQEVALGRTHMKSFHVPRYHCSDSL